PICSMAVYGTTRKITSPKATASAVVPARAVGPAAATSPLSSSGCREENITGWPSFANKVPSAPPSRPAPMVAIFILDKFAGWPRAAGAGMAPAARPPARTVTNFLRPAEKGKSFVITHSAARRKHKRRQDQTGMTLPQGINGRYERRSVAADVPQHLSAGEHSMA